MKKIIDNNRISTADILISAEGILPEIAVLKSVKPSYLLDAEGKRTDKVDFIRYECANPTDFSSFTLKVLSTKQIITTEELEDATEVIYVKIPLKEVNIKVYKVEYGTAFVSIIVPHIQLVTNSKEGK